MFTPRHDNCKFELTEVLGLSDFMVIVEPFDGGDCDFKGTFKELYIDWGDGKIIQYYGDTAQVNEFSGEALLPTSKITIYGIDVLSFKFIETSDILAVHIERNSKQTSARGMFEDLETLETMTANPTAFGNVTDMAFFASECQSLKAMPVIDTSNVTSLSRSWLNCRAITSFPLLDTSKVSIMDYAWRNCYELTSFPAINTSNVTSMQYTWEDNRALLAFPSLDTSSVTDMSFTWATCGVMSEFPELDLSALLDIEKAWQDCASLVTMPVLNTGSCTNFKRVFRNCSSLLCIGGIDTTSQTATSSMFFGCDSLNNPTSSDQATILSGSNWINTAPITASNPCGGALLPVITINGFNPDSVIASGQGYVDAGATATNGDGLSIPVTSQITDQSGAVVPEVDTTVNVAGVFNITYSATYNGITTTAIRVVNVTVPQ